MANKYTLRISQRTTFSVVFEYKEADGTTVIPLTGATAKAQIRRKPGAPELLADLTTVVSASLGKITVSLTSTETAALPVGKLQWDLLVTLSGITFVMVEGDVLVDGTVTE